jgi:catechol 2,3-dioxygenase-like lactoylglutathione lyase family enzyme
MNLDSAIFYTHSISTITDFYKDTLGFPFEYQDNDTYVSFRFENGARLGIAKALDLRDIVGAQTIIIEVTNIFDIYALVKEKNIFIYKEIQDERWGKTFSILDPDKNKIEFVQRL